MAKHSRNGDNGRESRREHTIKSQDYMQVNLERKVFEGKLDIYIYNINTYLRML